MKIFKIRFIQYSMNTLSVCIIAKDEEKLLGRCLGSVAELADEIVVVDTGSTDDTVKIARAFTQHVYPFTWCDDFSKARNFAFSKATSDYILWLDADDVLPDDSRRGIARLKEQWTDEDVVMLPYIAAFDEGGNPSFTYYRERILRREGNFLWRDPVHEAIVPHGKIVYENFPVEHRKERAGDPLRNLKIYLKLLSGGKKLTARQQFYYANELFYNRLYTEAESVYEQYLKEPAMLENKLQAHIHLARIRAERSPDEALVTLFSAFVLSPPSPELICEIGVNFMRKKDYRQAIYWYEQAIRPLPRETLAFLHPDCYGYIPYVQTALCHYYLGELTRAVEDNAKALALKPYGSVAKSNDAFYRALQQKND